jgi:small GTP-binding protein
LVDTDTTLDYYSETFQLPDGSYVNCEILDTGGQEKYNAINRQYYQRADCCVLVYDITRKDTFKECKNFYKKEIINNCKKGIKVILVGNKTDLEKDRKISTEMGAKFANENKYYFKETSCVTISNVVDAFETIIVMTHNDMFKNEQIPTRNTIRLSKVNNNDSMENNSNKGKKKKCC